MKNYLLLLLIGVVTVSCGPYQKALKSTDNEFKKAMIDTLLNKEKYSRAVNLFDQIIPAYRGTPEAEPLTIKYASALYQSKNYPIASYQYERFVQSYPKSEHREQAAFMAAKCHYNMSPIYSKSQNTTDVALVKLQDYINTYPDGKYIAEANELTAQLRNKLDKKAYEIAKNYHHRNRFIPAIKSLENFIIMHPGSQYMDDAQYYLLESQFLYASKSRLELIPERMQQAQKYYTLFMNRYPKSTYVKDAEKINIEIQKYLSNNTL